MPENHVACDRVLKVSHRGAGGRFGAVSIAIVADAQGVHGPACRNSASGKEAQQTGHEPPAKHMLGELANKRRNNHLTMKTFQRGTKLCLQQQPN
jgi:hypothetical protein